MDSSIPSPLIQAESLASLVRSSMILIDASFGKANFEALHLDGAQHVDLNSELSDIKEDVSVGGRHPLPTPAEFGKLLSRLGISKESHVVVYDDKYGANAAARFWWMLKAAGHRRVQVIDGGIAAAVAAGWPTASGAYVSPAPTSYPVTEWLLPTADMAEVEKVSQDEDHLVIDVRENERYLGQKEPIDLVAGHIPGAKNVPYFSNLDANGRFLSQDRLREYYTDLMGKRSSENVIVHCGSGVTACHTLLAMAQAGMEIPKLYVGSWSEWSRNGKPIITE